MAENSVFQKKDITSNIHNTNNNQGTACILTSAKGFTNHAGAFCDLGAETHFATPTSNSATSSSTNLNQTNAYSKTRMCSFFLAGRCVHGTTCHYAHSQSELKKSPDLRKTSFCTQYQTAGFCLAGSHCRYAHGNQELRATSDVYKTAICRLWKANKCMSGDLCRHAHGDHEMRTRVANSKKENGKAALKAAAAAVAAAAAAEQQQQTTAQAMNTMSSLLSTATTNLSKTRTNMATNQTRPKSSFPSEAGDTATTTINPVMDFAACLQNAIHLEQKKNANIIINNSNNNNFEDQLPSDLVDMLANLILEASSSNTQQQELTNLNLNARQAVNYLK